MNHVDSSELTARIAILVSKRRLFRLTFTKLVEVLDSTITRIEHCESIAELEQVPAGVDGLVILDAGRVAADDAQSDVLSVLSIQPEAHVVVVIDEQNDVTTDAVMAAGAMGVVIKSSPPQVLVDTLQLIIEGERCRPSPSREVAREQIPLEMRDQLTARQQKLLRAIMGGQSITATAAALGMTSAKVVSEIRIVLGILRGRPF